MPRFVIKNMVYDTKQMEYIGTVEKWYEFRGWLMQQIFGEGVGRMYDCEIYRSKQGNYLLVHDEGAHIIGEAISKSEAKQLLMHSDYDKYAELFGALEEA